MRASVLPCMTHPTSKETYFLLGRNKVVQDWSDGSATWSDFGGHCAASETTEACATREFIEESLEALVRLADKSIFLQSLLDKQYIVKLEFGDTTLYVVRFDWNPACCYEFASFRCILNSIHKLCKGYSLTADEQTKLGSLGWFRGSKSKILDILKHPAVYTRTVPIDGVQAQQAVQQLGQALQTHVTVKQVPSTAVVIARVDPKWLEKDKLQLFSTEQLRFIFCKLDSSIVLQSDFAQRLHALLEHLCFAGNVCEL